MIWYSMIPYHIISVSNQYRTLYWFNISGMKPLWCPCNITKQAFAPLVDTPLLLGKVSSLIGIPKWLQVYVTHWQIFLCSN